VSAIRAMIVAVAVGARPELRHPEDMRSFKIVAGPGLESEAALRAALEGVAELISEREAWVSQAWVRRASGRDAADEWQRGFQAMLAYAGKKGWVREEDGAIRAHIEGKP
jgi:hypothetical protein